MGGTSVRYVKKQKINSVVPELVRVRRYKEGDDLETISNIINEAYKKVYDDLCVGRVKRIVSCDEIVTDNLHLATLGHQIVGAMVVTPAAGAAAVGQPGLFTG